MEKQEIDKLVSKIRVKYREYAKKYGKSWFNADTFEERYHLAIRNRMDLKAFLLGEITFLEKLREKYESETNVKPFLNVVSNFIEENTARIQKYPKKVFHPDAGYELCYFYGAMSEFTAVYYPVMRLITLEDEFRTRSIRLEDELIFLAASRGKKESKRIQDHMLLLSRAGVRDLDIEKDMADYLKNCAFLLHDVIRFCDQLVALHKRSLENQLRFGKLFIEDSAKKAIVDVYNGRTGYSGLLILSGRANDIIDDFRLKVFKRQEQ